MISLSIDELAKLVVRLRLVEPAQMDQCLSRLGPTDTNPTDLVRVMEARHLLTSYQISRIEKGETDGLLLGEYKVLYRNGAGSFARVFRACSVEDGRMVGLKVLRERWTLDPFMVTEFHQEAELCKKLRHKNIVPIYEIGNQDEFHYFTMEFVEGGNLRDFLRIRKKLSSKEATKCVLDMCEGLAYALRHGITHRDLKLTNVLMSSRGIAKLVDFGLAGDEGMNGKGLGEGGRRALEYATLEKWTNAMSNDPRSDLFFLGAIYYELLTGVPPYARTRDREQRKQITRYTNVRPLHEVDPNIPRVVTQIVERLMKVEPQQRYQRVTDVISDLQFAQSQIEAIKETEETKSELSAGNGNAKTPRSLPTVMCIESRTKQQNILRDYLSKRGFRVLVLSDLQRGLNRLATTPPDCIVLMGESIGSSVVDAFHEATESNVSKDTVCIAVLAERQSEWMEEMEQTHSARILIQPITLRDLRREIHLAFQRRRHNRKKQELGSSPSISSDPT